MNTKCWLLVLAGLISVRVAPAQDAPEPAIRQFFNVEGAPVHKLWFFVNRIGFRYYGETEQQARLDENQEEEIVLAYDQGGVRKQLNVMVRIALENGPPMSPTMTKEHEIRGLTVWMELTEDDEEVGSFKCRGENFTVTKSKDVTMVMEPFTFRGVTFAPSVRYLPLHDLAVTSYYVRMDGLSFALTYVP
ncbi:MAG: hypothetical protein H6Q32_345 [Bacteroidetes bacterium]|nr:hypothetical protein [Bacteroidota bacterium]